MKIFFESFVYDDVELREKVVIIDGIFAFLRRSAGDQGATYEGETELRGSGFYWTWFLK